MILQIGKNERTTVCCTILYLIGRQSQQILSQFHAAENTHLQSHQTKVGFASNGHVQFFACIHVEGILKAAWMSVDG